MQLKKVLFNGKYTKVKPYTHVLFFESCLESITELSACIHSKHLLWKLATNWIPTWENIILINQSGSLTHSDPDIQWVLNLMCADHHPNRWQSHDVHGVITKIYKPKINTCKLPHFSAQPRRAILDRSSALY